MFTMSRLIFSKLNGMKQLKLDAGLADLSAIKH
jgi:hypothetical protein